MTLEESVKKKLRYLQREYDGCKDIKKRENLLKEIKRLERMLNCDDDVCLSCGS